MVKDFPTHVFEDIKPNDFKKSNKKGVSEDFVTENFKQCGWMCFRPFDDTGVDIVAMKNVCPNGHTKWDDHTGEKCTDQNCQATLIPITRFIQVKTRRKKGVNKNTIGYTLDNADIRADSRHILLIFSDAGDGDFIIVPMYDYLKIFNDHLPAGEGHFGVPSFRYGNMKVNNLKHTPTKKPAFYWSYGKGAQNVKIPFDKYLNESGMKNLVDPKFDQQHDKYSKEMNKIKIRLIHGYSKGEEFNKIYPIKQKSKKSSKEKQQKRRNKGEKTITCILKRKLQKTPQEIINMRCQNRQKFIKKIQEQYTKRRKQQVSLDQKSLDNLIESINGYFERFKGVPQLVS